VTATSSAVSNKPFEYKDAVEAARQLAKKTFQEPKALPEFLLKINYDQWRSIRFKPEKALWRADKLPFQVEFFHLGWLHNRKVRINVIDSNGVKPVSFSPDLFHYGMDQFKDQVPGDLGFAGFRLHYPINTPQYHDEVVVFLGASYLRAVARKEHFGLSARGLAIDTAVEAGEEFPYFREFWLVRPRKEAKTVTIFGLLDSPSLSGAYEFHIQPGDSTLMDVTATLFLRKEGKKLGVAPLNSMFFYGENSNIRPVDDFRPEVHDSDGLQILTSTGEWIWRPLIDPRKLLVTSFQLKNPKGFGLFQRDRNFDHYQDLEADYQLRPSLWIIPKGDWGDGRVELVEIPTDSEKNDNIVSYWVPESSPKLGSPVSFSYRMKWGPPETIGPHPGFVDATRTAAGSEKGADRTYLIDFEGEKLRLLPQDAKVEADIGVSGGEVVEQHIQKNSASQSWRLVFQVKKKEGALNRVAQGNVEPLELRAFLRQGNNILTETWSYVDPF
jgi:glucans biosynthesis protein